LRELPPIEPEQQAVVDVSRGLAAECADQLALQLGVGPVVAAAEDVRDPEVEIVDRGRELVRRAPVRAQERRAAEADRASVAGVPAEVRSFAVPPVPLPLPPRPLVPADPEPLEVAQDLLEAAVDVPRRIGVVDPQQQRPLSLIRVAPVRDRAESVAEMER